MPYIDANVFIYPIYMKIREQKTDFSRKSQFFLLSKMPLYDKMQIPNDIAK
jgi:hypothetical protein